MEIFGLIISSVLVSLIFPEYAVFILPLPLGYLFFKKYQNNKKTEESDKATLELLFRLSSTKKITEKKIAKEMENFNALKKYSSIYEKTSKLVFPEFGWRSSIVFMALKSALRTGNSEILSDAIRQITLRQKTLSETKAALSSQRYTLIFSVTITSAILGVVSSISNQNFVYYVLGQSVVSSLWLFFLGETIYSSLLFCVPLSVFGYFLAFKLM